jgi:hypothetical protein
MQNSNLNEISPVSNSIRPHNIPSVLLDGYKHYVPHHLLKEVVPHKKEQAMSILNHIQPKELHKGFNKHGDFIESNVEWIKQKDSSYKGRYRG